MNAMKLILVVSSLLLTASSVHGAEGLETLQAVRRRARADGFEVPNRRELTQALTLFRRAFGEARLRELKALAAPLKFGLRLVDLDGADVLLIYDQERHRGWGVYAVREGPSHELLLQAPHSYADRYTGILLERFLLEGAARAAAWNTTHRHAGHRVATRTEADLAKQHNSMFQCFTRAFAESFRRGAVVQVHGFSRSKRKTRAASAVDIIISGGTSEAPAWSPSVQCSLAEVFQSRVGIYPVDVVELGGTKNAQGKLLRRLGFDNFLHLELSLTVRRRLKEEVDLRRALLGILVRSFAQPERSGASTPHDLGESSR